MKKLFFMLAIMVAAVMTFSCGVKNSTIGDGKVDEVEAATIRLAVGAAMSQMPQTVLPAHGVSTALLSVMNTGEPVTVEGLEAVMDDKLKDLNLTPYEKQSFADLVTLVRSGIESRLDGGAAGKWIVVTKAVLEIVQEAAAARLDLKGA